MVKQNDTKNCQKENSLLNLNDEAFISFLYSERDRENNLNQVPGWSNWAIIGAIVAVLWTAYGIAKVGTIDVKSLLFYISGFIGLFWNYRSWANFFRRERGIDYGRVKLLKDVFPKVDVIMILICSLLMSVAIIHNHGLDIVAWFWWFWIINWLIIECYTIVATNIVKTVSIFRWLPISVKTTSIFFD